MTRKLETKHDQLHHERWNSKTYDLQADHRVHHQACTHTRFWDNQVPPVTGMCMDCGCEIELGTWKVNPATAHTDEQLHAERKRYNDFWGPTIEADAVRHAKDVEDGIGHFATLRPKPTTPGNQTG